MTFVPTNNNLPYNYISQSTMFGDFVGRWTSFKDAASPTPSSGIGGAPAVAISGDVSTNVLDNVGGRFRLFKNGSVNRQGEGVSYQVTNIAPMDKGKVLRFGFSYGIFSGSYADGDLQIWAVCTNVSGTTIVQLAPYQIKNTGSGFFEEMVGEFQLPIDVTSFRILIYYGTTSTLDFQVVFDNFFLGRLPKTYGSPITDWTSYIPTLTGTTNSVAWTNTSTTGKWRRVGDSAEIHIFTTFSALPAGGTGQFAWSIPSGMVIDTSKFLGSYGAFGIGQSLDSGVGFYDAAVAYFDTTRVAVLGAGAGNAWGNGIPQTWGAGDSATLTFKVPIVGWSSSQIMSSDADTRVVSSRASGSTTSVASSITTTIVNPTKTFDSHGSYNTTTGQYTVAIPGKYKLSTFVRFDFALFATGVILEEYVFKNGSQFSIIDRYTLPASLTDFVSLRGSDVLDLVAGDVIEVRVFQNAGASRSLNNNTFVTFDRISGPSQIAASESVNASYYTNAGNSFTSAAFTVIDFSTKIFDSHNAVTTGASWKFTAPIAGKYHVAAFVALIGLTGGTGEALLYLTKNNNTSTGYKVYRMFIFTGATSIHPGGSVIIPMLAGETIQAYLFQTNGATRSLEAQQDGNHIHIARVGN